MPEKQGIRIRIARCKSQNDYGRRNERERIARSSGRSAACWSRPAKIDRRADFVIQMEFSKSKIIDLPDVIVDNIYPRIERCCDVRCARSRKQNKYAKN
jgi:hypothetical protein